MSKMKRKTFKSMQISINHGDVDDYQEEHPTIQIPTKVYDSQINIKLGNKPKSQRSPLYNRIKTDFIVKK